MSRLFFTSLFFLLANLNIASEEIFEINKDDIFFERVSAIKQSIAKGANVNSIDSNKTTPLQYALIFYKSDIVKILIENGADVNKKNKFGAPPIFYAYNDTTIRLLLDAGANINYKTNDGITPLLSAIYKSNQNVAEKLIMHGADVNVISQDGTSPLHILNQRKNTFFGQREKNLRGLIVSKGGKDISIRSKKTAKNGNKTEENNSSCKETTPIHNSQNKRYQGECNVVNRSKLIE